MKVQILQHVTFEGSGGGISSMRSMVELASEKEAVMLKPVVNEDLCIGCGHCAEICPQVFELDNEKSQFIGPEKCGTCNCREALDENGRPRPVPSLSFENDDERRRNQEALMRKKMRLDQKTKEDRCQKDGICEL